jgi:hypothetical protein
MSITQYHGVRSLQSLAHPGYLLLSVMIRLFQTSMRATRPDLKKSRGKSSLWIHEVKSNAAFATRLIDCDSSHRYFILTSSLGRNKAHVIQWNDNQDAEENRSCRYSNIVNMNLTTTNTIISSFQIRIEKGYSSFLDCVLWQGFRCSNKLRHSLSTGNQQSHNGMKVSIATIKQCKCLIVNGTTTKHFSLFTKQSKVCSYFITSRAMAFLAF